MHKFLRLAAALCILFTGHLASAKTPLDLKSIEGTFLGIEQGDYAHWNMRAADGSKVSYFILKPDASVDKVLAKPERFIGRKCLVLWKATKENIPEAGGKMLIEQIVSVEWRK